MNIKRWLRNQVSGDDLYGAGRWEDEERRGGPRARWGGSLLGGLAGRSLEIAQVEEEVAAEQQGQVALVGLHHGGAATLLARLRQQSPVPVTRPVCREGFFTLVQLGQIEAEDPTADPFGEDGWSLAAFANTGEAALALLAQHDLILYLFPARAGWRSDDAHWFSRLRATGAPLLPVLLMETETEAGQVDEATLEGMRRLLGVRPMLVELAAAAGDGGAATLDLPADLAELVQRMLALRPRLAIPLAQEAPACRRMIARKVIRTGALMTLLLGSEPIPLLDLPLHVALQWKVALQLAAIYGRPGLDYRSREMAGTLLLSLAVRHLAQQAIKLVPFVGWLLSGLLSGVSTWLLGNALVRHYEEERILPAPPVPAWAQQVWVRADHLQRNQAAKLSTAWQRLPRVRFVRATTGKRAAEAQTIPVVLDGDTGEKGGSDGPPVVGSPMGSGADRQHAG